MSDITCPDRPTDTCYNCLLTHRHYLQVMAQYDSRRQLEDGRYRHGPPPHAREDLAADHPPERRRRDMPSGLSNTEPANVSRAPLDREHYTQGMNASVSGQLRSNRQERPLDMYESNKHTLQRAGPAYSDADVPERTRPHRPGINQRDPTESQPMAHAANGNNYAPSRFTRPRDTAANGHSAPPSRPRPPSRSDTNDQYPLRNGPIRPPTNVERADLDTGRSSSRPMKAGVGDKDAEAQGNGRPFRRRPDTATSRDTASQDQDASW